MHEFRKDQHSVMCVYIFALFSMSFIEHYEYCHILLFSDNSVHMRHLYVYFLDVYVSFHGHCPPHEANELSSIFPKMQSVRKQLRLE